MAERSMLLRRQDAVELLHVDIDRSKAQRALADIAHPAGVGSGGEDERGNCGVREHVSRAAADIDALAACIVLSVNPARRRARLFQAHISSRALLSSPCRRQDPFRRCILSARSQSTRCRVGSCPSLTSMPRKRRSCRASLPPGSLSSA